MPLLTLSPAQTRLLRLRSQQLLPGGAPADPAQALAAVCGVQAQEAAAARLSLRARSQGLTDAAIEQARQGERSIVRIWCQRGTLHLLASADAAWLVPLLGPGLIAAGRRRFEQLGWDEARAAAAFRLLEAALADQDRLTRAQIHRLFSENGLPFQGQAVVHLLFRAVLEGRLCEGPLRGKEPEYVRWEAWLGPSQPLPRPEALAQLARRYLAAYAPAGPADLAAWSGLKMAETRQAWQLIEAERVEVALDPVDPAAQPQPAWLLTSQLSWLDQPPPAQPHVRLLPRFDTLWLGYANRDWLIDPAFARRIQAGGGIIRPLLLVDGQVLGSWASRLHRGRLAVQIEPFIPLPEGLRPLIEAEAADLARFLGVGEWELVNR